MLTNTSTECQICRNSLSTTLINARRVFRRIYASGLLEREACPNPYRAPYQGLFVDYAFSGSLARDKEGKIIESSRSNVEGINGETAWILISDAQTKMLHGDTRTSKASPIKYLESFLEQYSPNVSNKFVVLDQGGELYGNPEILNLFCKYKYQIFPTGSDLSCSNGAVERAHRTITTSV